MSTDQVISISDKGKGIVDKQEDTVKDDDEEEIFENQEETGKDVEEEAEKKDEEHDREIVENDHIVKLEESTSGISEMNLVLILSYLSLSGEECPNLEEKESSKLNHQIKRGSELPATRKRQLNEFRAVERQSSKVNTKIRDCRHSRRL